MVNLFIVNFKIFSKILPLLSVLMLVVLVTASCSSSTVSAGSENYSNATSYDIIIDVRSPGEFSESALPSAININVESPDFVFEISSLDKDKVYNVYCRSGRRSAVAVDIMKDNGFRFVNDLGSLQNASNILNIPIS